MHRAGTGSTDGRKTKPGELNPRRPTASWNRFQKTAALYHRRHTLSIRIDGGVAGYVRVFYGLGAFRGAAVLSRTTSVIE